MDKLNMNSYRWNPYVLLSGLDVKECFRVHFTSTSKVLVIMSKGFDVRMNIALSVIKSSARDARVECLLINFDEGNESSSHQYRSMVERNMEELKDLMSEEDIRTVDIKLWHKDGQNKRRIGDRKAASIVDSINLSDYTDIFVDISALPRGIYFSLIGKLLTVIDAMKSAKPNFMVTVAENPSLDKATKDDTPDEEPNFLHGFSGDIDRSSTNQEEPLIWMPILGEGKFYHIKKAHNFLAPSETCPILPFPSIDPRRPDALTIDYHSLLFDELIVEQQNIMYVPEQNPFEAYKILCKAINNYHTSLKPIGNCKIVLSTFSSKLLSIGTLLAAYELKENDIAIGVLNVDSQGYRIDEHLDLSNMKNESNLFVIWLTGNVYEP